MKIIAATKAAVQATAFLFVLLLLLRPRFCRAVDRRRRVAEYLSADYVEQLHTHAFSCLSVTPSRSRPLGLTVALQLVRSLVRTIPFRLFPGALAPAADTGVGRQAGGGQREILKG